MHRALAGAVPRLPPFQFGQRDVFWVLVHYAQWAFYGHFVIAKLLVGENLALLRFFEVCEQLDDSLSVVFGSFAVLLAEVLAQRSADFVASISCTNPLRRSSFRLVTIQTYVPMPVL